MVFSIDIYVRLMYNNIVIEVWLSLVEYYVRDVGVGGSNPLTPTRISKGR